MDEEEYLDHPIVDAARWAGIEIKWDGAWIDDRSTDEDEEDWEE